MSDLTQCNYCKFKAIEARVRKTGARIQKVKSDSQLGGVEVHVTGPWEKPDKKNWECWMMEITDSCCC